MDESLGFFYNKVEMTVLCYSYTIHYKTKSCIYFLSKSKLSHIKYLNQ